MATGRRGFGSPSCCFSPYYLTVIRLFFFFLLFRLQLSAHFPLNVIFSRSGCNNHAYSHLAWKLILCSSGGCRLLNVYTEFCGFVSLAIFPIMWWEDYLQNHPCVFGRYSSVWHVCCLEEIWRVITPQRWADWTITQTHTHTVTEKRLTSSRQWVKLPESQKAWQGEG